ncbi:glycosyltransferase family 39 protein [Azospirillum doebereinerae]|uniref:Phospholipid carrier-dependent glycosyltransferase n=1 Tax=Azospirillum doebereinerae TaxID=92933 RepID=A0A3S0V7R8_9PROT|nr:phospholipid carrier-dependent glycosyltransferase [Azospirillum doebereinerae]RUQ74479.1 phospholipid carrier-dependent glycosyltransferase [Azospirillum doebereinerae]
MPLPTTTVPATQAPLLLRLSRAPWWALCLGIAAAMALSVLLVGFRLPYWVHADQDLVLAYHGLLFGDGLPQEYFDHPGYGYFLVIDGWYRLLHGLGLLPVATLSALPPAADPAATAAAWQSLVEAGRSLSILLTAVFAIVYATLVKSLVGDRRVALLAGILVAFGVGLTAQGRQMRTDLLSAGFVITALLLVLVAVRRPPGGKPALLLGLAGLLVGLAMVTKVQAVFLALGIPVVALLFGRRFEGAGNSTGSWTLAVLVGALALAALVPAAGLIAEGIAGWGRAVYPYKPVGGGLSGHYQGLVAGWALLGMTVHAWVWRVPRAHAATATAAVLLGLALGLLALDLRPNEQNVIAVANFVEHMFVFTSWRHATALQGQEQVVGEGLLTLLLSGVGRTLAIRTIVLHPDNIPQTIVVEWFALAGAAVLWRRGERLAAVQALFLLLVAWGLEALFSLRGFQRAYAAYTDPLAVLSAAWVLARMPELLDRAKPRRAILGGVVLVVVAAHAWPVVETRRLPNPATHCDWIPVYMPRVGPFPFCR